MTARLWLRTVSSVLTLVAFPALLVVLLAGLVVAEVLFLMDSVGDALLWATVIVPAFWVLCRGLRVLLGTVHEPARGVVLTGTGHPELWALVRRLAVIAGTRPPDEIRLVDEVTALVVEDTRLLGLVSARRVMFIGAPLFAGLREDQLAAVLTHELAHYGNWDTRLSGLAYRGRRAFTSTVSALDRTELLQRFLAWLLRGWLHLYLRVSSTLSQRQERAADAAAANAAGSAAAASALREFPVLETSWRTFTAHHLLMGWDAGCLPADILGGYAELRTAMAGQHDELRRHPPDTKGQYDTHPPIASRVATLEAAAAAASVQVGQRPAASLLCDPAATLDAAVVAGLGRDAGGMRRADWVTLAHLHGAASAAAAATALLDAAARLTGGFATLRTVLAVLDDGKLAELGGIRPVPGVGPRGQREQARPVVRDGLSAAVGLALVGVGAAGWTPDWPSCARLAADDPHDAELPRLVDAAVADRPDTTGLRALLDTTYVDLDRTATIG